MKIIIIDDNKPFRDSLKFYLEYHLGHKVICEAIDGIEFLRIEQAYKADAILMDIEMPNINGIQAVEIAMNDNPSLKFIAVTSYTSKVYLMELQKSGFKACVFKHDLYEDLPQALQCVSNNEGFFPEDIKIINKQNIN